MPLGSILKSPCNFLWRSSLLAPLMGRVFESWFSLNGWLVVESGSDLSSLLRDVHTHTHGHGHAHTPTNTLVWLSFSGAQTQFISPLSPPNVSSSALTSGQMCKFSFQFKGYIIMRNNSKNTPVVTTYQRIFEKACLWVMNSSNTKRINDIQKSQKKVSQYISYVSRPGAPLPVWPDFRDFGLWPVV